MHRGRQVTAFRIHGFRGGYLDSVRGYQGANETDFFPVLLGIEGGLLGARIYAALRYREMLVADHQGLLVLAGIVQAYSKLYVA